MESRSWEGALDQFSPRLAKGGLVLYTVCNLTEELSVIITLFGGRRKGLERRERGE